MPWSHCEVPSILDDNSCPTCGLSKAEWTLQVDTTRAFAVSTASSRKAKRDAWVEVQLLEADGSPAAGASYSFDMPDGRKKEGHLDDDGRVRLEKQAKGACRVTFGTDDPRTCETNQVHAFTREPVAPAGDPQAGFRWACSHGRACEQTHEFEVVPSSEQTNDSVTLLLQNGPDAVELVAPDGSTSKISAAGVEDGDYRRYELALEHTVDEGINFFKKSYQEKLREATVYTVSAEGFDPFTARVYSPRQYALSLSFPRLGGMSLSRPLASGGDALTDFNPVDSNLSTERWEASGDGWTGEASQEAGGRHVPSMNVPTGTMEFNYTIDDDKAPVPFFSVLASFLLLTQRGMSVIGLLTKLAPTCGWYVRFDMQLFQGSLNVSWGWKEHTDHRAYLAPKIGVDLTVISAAMELGWGVEGIIFRCELFGQLNGSIGLAMDVERISPDGDQELSIPFKPATLGAQIGARVEAGHMLKFASLSGAAVVETGLELEITLHSSSKQAFWMTVTPAWTGVTGVVTYSVGGGRGAFGFKRSKTFVDRKELETITLPSEAKYVPDVVTRDTLVSILVEALTAGKNVQVKGKDAATNKKRTWKASELADMIADVIDARPLLKRDGHTVKRIASEIRTELDLLADHYFFRIWKGAVPYTFFEQFLEGPPFKERGDKQALTLPELLEGNVDPTREMLQRHGVEQS